jgi:hypothetical protein
MLIINSREFRQNQKVYFDLIDKNEQIIIQRGKNKAYKIVPVDENDRILSEEEFKKKIDESIIQAQNGETLILTKKNQKDFLTYEL